MKDWIKTPAEINSMRRGGRILAEVLEHLRGVVKAGMTTREIADISKLELKKRDAEAAFLDYNGFPSSICVSVNEQVVHGIPGDYVIKDGDIVGLDLGVLYENMITDGAITIPIGPISVPADKLLKNTKLALENAVAKISPGVPIGDVSHAIEKTLKSAGLSIVRDLSGHGVGRAVHEEPEVHNQGTPGSGPQLEAGMTIAVEPMACLGDGHIRILPDKWTIATADGNLAAQFEHTILVTENGAEVLTKVA